MNMSGKISQNRERLLIPLTDACVMLGGVCRQFIMGKVAEGEMACVRFGRKVFFTPDDLKQFVSKNRIKYNPTKIKNGEQR